MEGHGRSWKVMEGQERSGKAMEGLILILCRCVKNVRKVMGGGGL